MDINALLHLKYIFAAAEYGSMRRVAQAFGVHESSVSRNILLLEQYLDLQLFDRGSNGVRLTKTGRAWLNEIRVHYEKLEEALARRGAKDKEPKSVRDEIGFPTIYQRHAHRFFPGTSALRIRPLLPAFLALAVRGSGGLDVTGRRTRSARTRQGAC